MLITGGAGYVGMVLVPLLLKSGFDVVVYDLFWFGNEEKLEKMSKNNSLQKVKADIRDLDTIKSSLKGCTDVIHLACISNDPSFDLDPKLGKSINYDCFEPLVKASKEMNIKRFIYASSSSVYGVKKEKNVTESLDKEPLTDYSKYKSLCEEILFKYKEDDFVCTILRPATVCGYSPRQRLDVVVNILTNHALNNNIIKIFNGEQLRPNIHINDMARAYLNVLNSDTQTSNGKIYNVGGQNLSINQIANLVSEVTSVSNIITERNDDIRSYHISSEKIELELEFKTIYSVKEAVQDLALRFNKQEFKDPLNNPLYNNMKFLKENIVS